MGVSFSSFVSYSSLRAISEAIQLTVQQEVKGYHATFYFSIIWIASLSLAMTAG